MYPWDKIFLKKQETRKVENFIKDFFNKYRIKNSKVLDLGCGTGRHSIFFAQKGLEVVALDLSEIPIRILADRIKGKSYGKKIKLVTTSAGKIPCSNDYFDIVASIAVLHHGTIKQIKSWFKEVKRVLKKGGYLLISVLSKNDFRYNSGREIEKGTKINIKNTFDPESLHHFFSQKEITNILRGYKIISIRETARATARGWDKFIHLDIIARKIS